MKVMAWIGGTIVAILIIAAVVVGGQQAGFWLKTNQTQFEAENFRNSYANQESLREDLAQKNAEVVRIEAQITELKPGAQEEAQKLGVQAEAITQIACKDVGQMNELTPEASQFAADRCGGLE